MEKKIASLEKQLYFKTMEIKGAHEMCDELDVPKHDSALVGHRLLWFKDGKRDSFKTSDNTDGYSPEEYTNRMRKLEEIRTPTFTDGDGKKSFKHRLNILNDE